MKKALVLVAVTWFVLFSSSSFACDFCKELEKRGFSPERIEKGISEHFGGKLKIRANVVAKPFDLKKGVAFDLAADRTGKIFRVKEAENLRGKSFEGTINDHPIEIFIANGVKFIGLKTNGSAYSLKPARTQSLATRSFELATVPTRQATIAEPEKQATRSTEVILADPKAEQIIEASMGDAPILLAPANQALRDQKEMAAKTEQLASQVEVRKKDRKQKLVDAGVTTGAIVSGLAIPVYGPFIAGGIILTRVGWGLFQNDSDEE